MLGRTEVYEMNGDVRIPPLTLAKVAFERVSGRIHEIDGSEEIDWGDDRWIWALIVSYVAENRLSAQFAAAYETLMCALVQPRPSSMEATVYWRCPITIVLPPFMPTRAKIPTALVGEEFTIDPLAKEFVTDFSRAPAVGIARAALLNYMHWYGCYAVIENEVNHDLDWQLSLASRAGGIGLLEQPTTRAAVTSVITGHEVTTCMSEDCFVYINFEHLATICAVVIASSPDGSYNVGQVVVPRMMPPPTSGCLILGATNAAVPAVYHLTASQQIVDIQNDDDVKYMFAVRLANAYRLFGHEVGFENLDGEVITPWAPVKELVIDPTSMGRKVGRHYTARPTYSDRRPGRSVPLPAIYEQATHEDMLLTIAKPVLVICPYGSKDRIAQTRVVLTRKPKPITFSVRSTATASYRKSEVTVKKGDQSGFHTATSVVAPRHPGPVEVSSTGPVDMTQISGDAEFAGQHGLQDLGS
jgi:hypothetical protein